MNKLNQNSSTNCLNKAKIILFVLCILGSTNCKKGQDHYNVPDWFKEWTVFSKGSYWIYKNEISNKQDCTYVEKAPELWVYSESSKDPIYDHIVVTFKSPFLVNFTSGAGKDDYADLSVLDINSSSRALTTSLIVDPQYYSGNGHTFGVIEVFSNLTVNNSLYHNVYHTRYSELLYVNDSAVRDYYFAKNIGLVIFKMRTGNIDTMWSLVRHHVIQ